MRILELGAEKANKRVRCEYPQNILVCRFKSRKTTDPFRLIPEKSVAVAPLSIISPKTSDDTGGFQPSIIE